MSSAEKEALDYVFMNFSDDYDRQTTDEGDEKLSIAKAYVEKLEKAASQPKVGMTEEELEREATELALTISTGGAGFFEIMELAKRYKGDA